MSKEQDYSAIMCSVCGDMCHKDDMADESTCTNCNDDAMNNYWNNQMEADYIIKSNLEESFNTLPLNLQEKYIQDII